MMENNFIEEGADLHFRVDVEEETEINDLQIGISIYAEETNVNLAAMDKIDIKSVIKDGRGQAIIKFTKVNLKPGIYIVYFWLGRSNPMLTYDALNFLTSPCSSQDLPRAWAWVFYRSLGRFWEVTPKPP